MHSFALAVLLCVSAGSCARGRSADESGPLARRLLSERSEHWRTISVPGARLHFARDGSAGTEATAVAESVTVIRRELLALLHVSASDTAQRADLFFLSSRDDMRRLVGRPIAGFVQEREPTGVFVVTPGYRYGSLLRHELAHLYSFVAWGPPHAGRWLVEGFAAWTAGRCQGYTPDQLAAGAMAQGRLASLSDLTRDFDRLAEDVAVPQAASIVGFLVRHEGLEAVRRRWSEPPGPGHPLGANEPDLESAWRDELTRVSPASLDVPRLLQEGC